MTTLPSEPLPHFFAFDNTYVRELEGCYVPFHAVAAEAPRLVRLNHALAQELGANPEDLEAAAGLQMLAGNLVPAGAQPVALAYAGHQFGGFSPSLGDGRALLLGEVIDRQGRRRDLAFKGSGATPFSRGGDGLAALGPVLREYLMGEAMHALGIPTTRALAAVTTGDTVYRERPLPGALLTRVASSHVRVGTFEYFAARGDFARLRRLADYVIARHYPEILEATEGVGEPGPYLALLSAVCERQASLVASWMHVGFIHGVMNTDNMSISGETIDYGPCAFMDSYDPATVFSSIDTRGRYAYGNQPRIALWNLTRFAETLLALLGDEPREHTDEVVPILEGFGDRYEAHWLAGMRRKLGLEGADQGDMELAQGWLELLEHAKVDYTRAFRLLAQAAGGDEAPLLGLLGSSETVNNWLQRWRQRQGSAALASKVEAMNAVNPCVIPRNHLVEEALEAAVEYNNYQPFEALLVAITHPYEERPAGDAYAFPPERPDPYYRTFCGT